MKIQKTLLSSAFFILSVSFLLMGMPQSVAAQNRCGDGACSVQEKEADSCDADCGGNYRGFCGNRVCELGESCSNCPEDCGSCSSEKKPSTTKSYAVPEEVCGDGVCEGHETCSACSKDCGECPTDWAGKAQYQLRRAMRLAKRFLKDGYAWIGLDGAVATVERWQEGLEKNAQQRQQAAQELMTFLEKYESVGGSFSKMDQSLVKMVGESDSVLNAIPSMRVRSKLRKVTKKDGQKITGAAEDLFATEEMKLLLSDESLRKIQRALDSEDPELLQDALPAPTRSLRSLQAELDKLQEDVFGKDVRVEHRLIPVAYAAGKDPDKNASDSFLSSLKMLQEMRERAINPQEKATSLEEDIMYLQRRGTAIAGIIGIAENDYIQKIEGVEAGVKSNKKKNVLNALNILRFLRASENFQAFEESMHHNVSRLRRGIVSLFAWHVAPTARAADILEEKLSPEELAAVKGGTLDAQKNVVLSSIDQHKQHARELLVSVPESERNEFEARIAGISQALSAVETSGQLQANLEGWVLLLEEIQDASRREAVFWKRILYSVQDFFGLNS